MKALYKRISVVLLFCMMLQLFTPYQLAVKHVGAANDAEEGNLIPNGDFEEMAATTTKGWSNGFQAKGWGIWLASGNGQATVTDEVFHSGAASVQINHAASARTGLSIDVPISAGETYTFGTWMKTENVVSNGGIFVRTQFYKKINGVDGSTTTEKIADGPSTMKLDGTNDWTLREMVLSAPSEAKYVRLEPFFEVGTGTAWFDHMTLVPRKGVTKLEVEPKLMTLEQGQGGVLTAILTPQDAEDQSVIWTSSNEGVASVENGMVTAHHVGSAVITVSTPDGLVKADSIVTVESEDQLASYNTLRQKWYDKLIGGLNMDIADSDVAEYIAALSERTSNVDGTGIWDQMSKTPDADYLWADMIQKTNTNSAAISKAYSTIRSLAIAYSTEGTTQFGSTQLKDDIIMALDWMHTYQYNETKTIAGNWFDWEIATPQAMMDILVLLYNDLTEDQLEKYLTVIDTFVPDPTKRVQNANVTETGANLLDKAIVVVLRGIVGQQSFKIEQGQRAMEKELLYVKSGDGIYEDGSLVQHFNVAYTGAYGGVLIGRMADLLYLFNESPWESDDPNVANVYKWIEDSFEALIYKGAMMDMTKGRSISRQTDSDHLTGRAIIRTIARLAEGAPSDKAAQFKSMIKEWVQSDTTFDNYYENMPIYEMNLIKATMSDDTIAPRGELVKHQNFAGMDRVVHLRPSYGFALSMFSDRISAFEYGNGENKKGWYTGIGMTNIYNNDLSQYSNQYWPTVDMYRLAGTTTDGYAPAPKDWGAYYNSKDWVGGSSIDGLFGAAGMDFSLDKSTGSTLQGKKSWFMFDDEIVALGSGITSSDNRVVETIVENRQLTQQGTNKLTVDGEVQSEILGWEETMTEISWAHLEGNTATGSDIGYYFPGKADITGKREARTGNWNQINNGGSLDEITRNYLSLAFNHGKTPQYAYVLLPDKDTAATEQYSENPDIEILSQSDKVHAVRENKLGITGFNFWEASQAEFVRASSPASIMVKEEGDQLSVAVSDPTQKQHKLIIDLGKVVVSEIVKDASITVLQTTPYLKLEVDTTDSIGKSHVIQFQYDPTQAPELGEEAEEPSQGEKVIVHVVEDTYVNAGSKANQAFGSAGYLNIKNGVSDYLRKTLLKYDLSGISGEIKSVTLNVYGKANDSRGTTSKVAAHEVNSNEWSEAATTWNNMPAIGAAIESITLDSENKWRQYDVTSFAKSRMELDKLMSIALQGETDLTVEIRSKENEGGLYKSYLEITLAADTLPEPEPEPNDEFDALREKWFNYLTGGAQIDLSDADIRSAVEANALKVTNEAKSGVWDTLNKDAGRTYLWSDYNSTTNSSHVTLSYNRLKDMAIAYATPGTELYHNAQLKTDIIAGLDWMNQNRYNTTRATYNNWWDWEIGSPLSLADIVTLMYDDLTDQQIRAYTGTIDRFIPDPTKRLGSSLKETGANLLDKSLAVLLRGVLGKSEAKVEQSRAAIDAVFPYVTSGDGFYADGSFIQHNNIAYTGSYGSVLLSNISKLLTILDHSSWPIQADEFDNVWSWVTDSFEPLIYDGHIMEMVSGRAVSRFNNNTRGAVWTILRLAQFAPENQAAYYKSMVKDWMLSDTSVANMYAGMPIRDIINFKQLMNDPSVTERGALITHRQFSAMDRIVHAREGYTFGISMSSARISNFEGGVNGEHMKGWYTGDGMTYLYNRDNVQFRDAFWPTVDSYRMPGTTTDGLQRSATQTTGKTWVGGSSIDNLYGSAGMELAPPGSKLTGKKSWFMFDDEIVALGADITTPNERKDGGQVETIVENRMINTAGTNKLTVDGDVMPNELGWSETLRNVGWAHLEGTEAGADIGYYFPGNADVDALREARAGSWKEVNATGPEDKITRNYVSLALEHGVLPTNAAYSYVLLPSFNTEATKDYSENPDIRIMSNTAQIQAVQETKLGITGINFWQAGELERVRTYQPASVMLKEQGDELTISVSDPTQTQAKVKVDIAAVVLEQLELDPTVRVLQASPIIQLEIDTKGSKGISHTIKLKIDPNVNVELPEEGALEPDASAKIQIPVIEDSYVAGGAANENINFGDKGFLNIRNGSGQYDRRVFLKYSLLPITGEIEKATLNVYGQTKDSNGTQSDIGVYEVNDDSWNETTITYNNKPAEGAQIDWQTIASPDQWWQFNVTPFIQSKLQADNEAVSFTLKQIGKDLHAEVRSRKSEGGMYQSYLEIVLKDTEAPVTTVQLEGKGSINTGYEKEVTLVFSANDNEHGWGVLRTEFRTDGGKWEPLKDGKLVIQELGNHQVEFRSVDKAGNIEETQSLTITVKRPTDGSTTNPGGSSTDTGKVTTSDLELIANYLGLTNTNANWDQIKAMDVNGDGKITVVDIAAMARRVVGAESNSAHTSSQGTASYTLNGDNVKGQEGELVTFSLNGENVRDLYAYELKLSYDPAYLEFVEASSAIKGFTMAPIVKEGQITFIHSMLGDTAGAEGQLEMGSLVFKIKQTGASEVGWDTLTTVDHILKEQAVAIGQTIQVGQKVDHSTVSLNDINGHWSEAIIRKAVLKGLITGYPDETFRPNQQITRAEFTTLIVRGLGLMEETEITFDDAGDLPSWAKSDIAKGIASGFITGYPDNTFRADQAINRMELAVMAAKAAGISEGDKTEFAFTDMNAFPDWAQGWIAAAVDAGLVQGRIDNSFDPQGAATRAEAIVVIMRMIEMQQ